MTGKERNMKTNYMMTVDDVMEELGVKRSKAYSILKQLNDELTKLQSGETNSVIFSEYNEQFQAFGLILIFLLIAEICVLESKNPLMKNVRLFKKKK